VKHRCDRGNVSLEFIAISLFLLIPICYLAVCALSVTQTFLTITAAARTGTRVFVTSDSDGAAHKIASQIIREQLKIGQLEPAEFSTLFSCSENPCLTPNGFVTVTIKGSQTVVLPLLRPIRIAVASGQTIEVDAIR